MAWNGGGRGGRDLIVRLCRGVDFFAWYGVLIAASLSST